MDRFLQNNTVLRIIAVILSCILWLTVNAPASSSPTNQGGTIQRQFPFQVQVETASDMVATQISSPTAVVTVNADVLSISSLSSQMLGVAVIANARGLGPGKHTVSLGTVNMPAFNYTISPSTISIVLEKKTQLQRNVKISVQGTPASGYMAGTPTTDTPVVQIKGSKEVVESVNSVVANISIQGSKASVTKSVPLIALNSAGKPVTGVEVIPANVNVTVPIEAPQVNATVVPQVVGSLAPGYAVSGVTISPSSVVVYGAPNSLPKTDSISVPVDVAGLRKTTTLQTQIPLVPGVTQILPSKVQVTVTVEASASKFLTGVPIQVQNVPSGKQVTLVGPNKVNITVSGPKSLIDTLNASSITAYIDASQLTAQSTSAPVNVLLPNWLQVSQISLNQVPVVVK